MKKKAKKGMFGLLKGHTFLIIINVLLVIFHRVSYSYVPLFSQYLIKYVQTPNTIITDVNLPAFLLNLFNNGKNALHVVLLIAAALLVWQTIRFTTMVVEKYLQGKMQEKIARKLRVNLFDHIQSLSYHYHNNSDTGDHIQRVTSDVETTTGFVVVRFLEAVGLVFTIVSGAYQMYFLSPLLMSVALITLPIYAVSSIIYFGRVKHRYEDIENKEAEIMTVIQENVHNMKIVKAFANEGYEISKLEEKNNAHKDARIKMNKIVGLYWSMMDFISLGQYLVITLIGVSLATKNVIGAEDVAAALMLVGMLIWPVRGLGRLINDFSQANVAMSRINEILEQTSEFNENGTLTPPIEGDIVFKDVCFKFPEDNTYALENLNFHIKKGQTVAFVGRTGSGKTTIINLIMQMYPYEGSILIDGVELREIEKHYMRKNIGSVLQNPFLYSRTIKENISITKRDLEMSKIEAASSIATIDKEIHSFSLGYETMVGERGTTLSGGQKQRVAIARVLVSDLPILIFDDALSAVDNKTDTMIRKALADKEHQSTNIIITHRITTAKEADQIIVLDNKTVEAIGTHATLANKPGLYQTLWQIQGNLEEQFLAMLAKEEGRA